MSSGDVQSNGEPVWLPWIPAPRVGQALMAMCLAGAIGFGVWHDWDEAVDASGDLFKSNAQTLATSLDFAARHAAWLGDQVHDLLGKNQAPTQQALVAALGRRLQGGEIVEIIAASDGTVMASTDAGRQRIQDWRAQIERAQVVGTPAFGVAQPRDGVWVLPVLVSQGSGTFVAVSFPVRGILDEWVGPRSSAKVDDRLMGADGRVLLTLPFREHAIGKLEGLQRGMLGASNEDRLSEGGGFGLTRSSTGDRLVVGWSAVPGTRLTVAVSGSLGEVTKAWLRDRAWLFGAFGLILFAAAAAVRSWSNRSRDAARTERDLITERSARLEAESRSAAKTAFLSSMSHEIRTPLNAVIGYAQIISRDPNLSADEIRDRVKRIEKAGWHLLELIDDVLDLAAVEAGATNLERKPISLREVVEQAMELIEAQAQEKSVTMQLRAEETWVMGDARRVRQVVSNLVSNAVKYNVERGQVQVTIERAGSMGLIRVRDSGMGMTRGQLMRLYEPFNRLGREESGVKGSGIGLSITKALIERMGGELSVKSQAGKGSTFEVRLPSADLAVRVTEPPPSVQADEVPKTDVTDVLCVEDNEVNAMVLQETLGVLRPHWRFARAESLVAASRLIRERSPDLVFLDQQLPDGEGLAWVAEEAQVASVDARKVVMLTADAMPALKTKAMELGVLHFLNKPFEMAALAQLLDRLDKQNSAQGSDTRRTGPGSSADA